MQPVVVGALAAVPPIGRKVWLNHGPRPILAEVVASCRGEVTVRWFLGPTQTDEVTVPIDQIEDAQLSSQQRVFVPPGDYWRYGRLVAALPSHPGEVRRYFVALPDGCRAELGEDEFHVPCEAFPIDPLDSLIGLAQDTPFFWQHRSRFVREMIRQRQASCGLTGLMAGRIALFAHQVEVARRVLRDPRQRYLLADEVGLGKTVESGIVIRQYLLDDESGQVVVLCPAHLATQWRAELRDLFDLDPERDQRVQVLPHADGPLLAAPPGLLVIDEAHHLLRGRQTLRQPVAALARRAPRLLLLSATPVIGQESELLELLSWLEPQLYSLDDLPAFRRRVARRGPVGTELMLLRPGMPSFRLRGVINRLRDLFGGGADRFDDPEVVRWCGELLALSSQSPVDQEAINRRIVELRLHVSECYRLHRRLIRHRRRGLSTPLARRRLARVEGELDPGQVRGTWGAFDRWRARVAEVARELPLLAPALEAVFRELVQAVGCWAGFARDVVRARLGELDPTGHPDCTRLETVRAARLVVGEEPLLRELLGLLDDTGQAADRVALQTDLLRYEARRMAYLPKTVIFTGPTSPALAIADRLKQKLFLRVAVVVAGMSGEQVEAEVQRFRQETGVSILVCDSSGSEGLNLQFAARLIHFDLPLNPFEIEQRMGRLDRLTRLADVPTFVLCSKVPPDEPGDPEAFDDVWFDLLRDGFGVFNGSISDLSLFAERTLPALVHSGFFDGPGAWRDVGTTLRQLIEEAVPGLRQAHERRERETDEVSPQSTVTLLSQAIEAERAAIDAQDAVDAIDLEPRETEALLQAMQAYDADIEPLRGAVHSYLKFVNNIDVERLSRADADRQTRWHSIANVLLREDWYTRIAPLLLRPMVYDRSGSRRDGDNQFMRLGHPLIDELRRFAEADDRGRSFALWRVQRRHAGEPRLFYRLDYAVEACPDRLRQALGELHLPPDRLGELERLADSFLPPRFEEFYFDEAGELIGPGDERRAWLERPYDKKAGDRSLSRGRLRAITEHLGLSRWTVACEQVRQRAEPLIPSDPAYSAACAAAAARVAEHFARRIDQVRLASRDLPEGQRRAAVADEETLRDALDAAVRRPSVRLDAAGVVVLANSPCPVNEQEEGHDD
jgi:ATP-dependent helicase HepA